MLDEKFEYLRLSVLVRHWMATAQDEAAKVLAETGGPATFNLGAYLSITGR